MKEFIYKIRLRLVWILLPKNKLRTPLDIAEETYERVIKIYPDKKTTLYFVISAIITYRFPNLKDLHNEAIEYSKKKDTITPKIGDYNSFYDAARYIYFWIDSTEKK